eukprot:c7342_g1_i1.p1 GENE.c7342_g1_i1~~c7342_g1_i1.p1  ORF type:complete len:315 (-),score=72.10 c7342_g1_i1:47-949(-)
MTNDQVRIFVSGSKSHAGKSSVCLGLLGALLKTTSPSQLAYIKPATQDITSTLVARFCQTNGIDYCHVGPVVFYRGFTRKFLDGELGKTGDELLKDASDAVERISVGKKVVIIDGVGYPAVGSVCGVSNAHIAHASRSAVLLVTSCGVGDAIDSHMFNSAFFTSFTSSQPSNWRSPVLGAVFNRAAETGFYSLDKCLPYLQAFFAKNHIPSTAATTTTTNTSFQKCYGGLRVFDKMSKVSGESGCSLTLAAPTEEQRCVQPLTDEERLTVQEWVDLFCGLVDVDAIVRDASALLLSDQQK